VSHDFCRVLRGIAKIQNLKSKIGIIILIWIAAWLRFWQLDTIPPGLWFDESYNGLDVVWMRNTGAWPIFLLGNNGREALYHYLLLGATTLWGDSAYTLRFVSAWLGVLAIALIIRWANGLFEGPHKGWLTMLTAAGLTVSFWAVLMNRTAYRANLMPLLVMAVSYFFWRGWKTERYHDYAWAGLCLGVGQYTYFSARLLPLAFGGFVILQTLLLWRTERARLKRLWLGLLLMSVASGMVALPMLNFMFNNPTAFWGRVQQVRVKTDVLTHLLAAMRLFIDGQDPNWRHHFVGRPMFDILSIMAFWVGLGTAMRRIAQPAHQFLLILLFVMWLPAPLADPPIHTLRLAGILPPYYALVALGLVSVVELSQNWQSAMALAMAKQLKPFHSCLVIFLLFSGLTTSYNYFWRWGQLPRVYDQFDSPIVALAHQLTDPTTEVNLVIPYYFYTHATLRYLLNNHYNEQTLLPTAVLTQLKKQSMVPLFVPPYPPDDNQPPAYVWLIKPVGQTGQAYVSAVQRNKRLADLAKTVGQASCLSKDNRQNVCSTYLPTEQLLPLFPTELPAKQADVMWADNLRLTGYEFLPSQTSEVYLYLAWQILGQTSINGKLFLQLLDAQANPINQFELMPLSRKIYRWRPERRIMERHPLPLTADLATGLYFVRLGFFDPATMTRLPIQNQGGDEAILGPLYHMRPGESISPTMIMEGRFGQAITLVGYDLKPEPTQTHVTLYWQATASPDLNYTAFVQLLDEQGKIVAQNDAQPLKGLYPTSRWQKGDRFYHTFTLAITTWPAQARLITGLYDLGSGVRLPAYDAHDVPLPDGVIELFKTTN